MSRDVFTKLIVVVVILGLAHGIFWFFKAGQIEKNINNFVSANSANISVGEVEVSGFPFSQKVSVKDLKFTLPHSSINRYQISVRELEATSRIFGSDFQVSLKEQVTVQDSESSISGYVEFTSQPVINFTISDGSFEKLTYKDSGHKVFDAEKNVLFATSSAQINFESSIQDDGKVKNIITADVKEIEGFDIISVYKNSSERKIIDGIKTGEVSIGSSVAIPSQPSDGTDEAVAAPSASISPNKVILENSTTTSADNSVKTATVSNNSANPTSTTQNQEVAANNNNATSEITESSPNQIPANADVAVISAETAIKSNFAMNLEYELVPLSTEQSQNLSDPTQQVQENAPQYSKVVNIKTLEFSNSLYKISINGQMNIFQDDTYPSGSVSVKVENLDNLLNHLSNGLSQIAEQKKPETEIKSSDLSVVDGVTASNQSVTDNNTAFADPYQNFLQKLVSGLPAITKEIAQKNQLSDSVSATFDIRREKNIEFLVNETPLREILGKF